MSMNSLNLRQAILERVKGKSSAELTEVIEGSVGNDERALPGLGVLFEVIWQHADSDTRLRLADTLEESVAADESP